MFGCGEDRRVGRFSLAPRGDFMSLMKISKILRDIQFVPYRAEYLYECRGFEYVGYSPYFDIIGPNEKPPEYAFNLMGLGREGVVVQKIIRLGENDVPGNVRFIV